jgi:hypothetical protein
VIRFCSSLQVLVITILQVALGRTEITCDEEIVSICSDAPCDWREAGNGHRCSMEQLINKLMHLGSQVRAKRLIKI